jgi:hypothetical protein
MTPTLRTHGAKWLALLLGFGQFLITVAVIGTTVWLVVTFPVWFSGAPRLPLPVEVSVIPDSDFLTLEPGTSPFREYEMGRLEGELEVKFEGAWTQWIYIFFALQEFLLIMFILVFLQRIVASTATGEAFSRANAKRLRWVGGLLILESLFGPGAATLISKLTLHGVDTIGGTLSVNWFRDFAQGGLKQDQSLTI